MKRIVVTGYGIISCLGNDRQTVLDSLRHEKSGIRFKEEYQEMGMRSHVAGSIEVDLAEHINRRTRRFMGNSAGYACLAMRQSIEHAGLAPEAVSNNRTGLIMGSGGGSFDNIVQAADMLRSKGIRKVGPFVVPRTMSSTVSACLATAFKIKGVNYSISSACATSAHCIGNAMEQIQAGRQDIIFAGGGEEEHWSLSMQFDAMGALSTNFNDAPEIASRPYDVDRDGFVIAGGAGVVVLEDLEHALSRGAEPLAEVVGYGITSDGEDMVAPSGEGAIRCMRQALATVRQPVQYLNTHGTSTPAGDIVELNAIKEAFGDEVPKISSTKSLSGHSLGAASVHEFIYCLLMMENNFIAASANINTLDEGAKHMPIVTECQSDVPLNTVMSNSFGFGGTNACLVIQKYD